jgi:iron complex outermembrane receptor protein
VEGLYVDQNNDGIINDIDRLKYKNPRPKVSMGFSTSVSYNNLSLVMNARANFGNYNYNNVSSNAGIYQNLYYSQGYFNNVTSDITEANFSGAQYLSDYYVTDASFFRMDNMTLSYRLNNFLTDKINLNISLTGQNVFVITKYEGLDPEVNGGIDNNIYPRPRIILLGFNVQFNN